MYMIGFGPVPAQTDVTGLLSIGALLAVLLAIAVALRFVTAPRSADGRAEPGPSDQHLGSAA